VKDTSFEFFQKCLQEQGVEASNVAGVILETYQGASGAFAPKEFMGSLRQWCSAHKILLVCDEVQAGFGRTGTWWGFEHYGIVPDLATFGKGISSSLPLGAVAGIPAIMDLHPAGSMTSTHTGNPVCCAAALASIDCIEKDKLADNARAMGDLLHARLRELAARYPHIGCVAGKGLVAGVACVRPGGTEPDPDAAFEIVRRMVESGVMMFTPVGVGGATVKINPPLTIAREALEESLAVFAEVVDQVFARHEVVAG
jgi:4-aminobutyrate aminotransferase-like enzyme